MNTHNIPQDVIDSIRVILGITSDRGEVRREKRHEARKILRKWLSDIGGASPQEIVRSVIENDKTHPLHRRYRNEK